MRVCSYQATLIKHYSQLKFSLERQLTSLNIIINYTHVKKQQIYFTLIKIN